MHVAQMGWGDITTLQAVPTQAGDAWRIFIEWASGRIQYISGFESLQDAENWITKRSSELAARARRPIMSYGFHLAAKRSHFRFMRQFTIGCSRGGAERRIKHGLS